MDSDTVKEENIVSDILLNSEQSSCTDLVVFSYASPFSEGIKSAERIFTINNQTLRLKQAWKSDGKGGTDIGFGASIYNCSFVLSHFLDKNPDIMADKVIVEIGCGPGLASLASLVLGSKLTIATDGDQISVDLAQENINSHGSFKERFASVQLLWGNEEHIQNVCNTINRRIPEKSKADVVLAADVAALPYENHYDDLVTTLYNLSDVSSKVLLCYQRRHSSEDRFFEILKTKFTYQRLPRASIHSDFSQRPIFIYECSRIV